MATTVDKIVQNALRLLTVKEVGETLTYDESEDGRIALNNIIEQMNLESGMQPAKVEITQALTASDGEYTFGSGGDNSTRPLEIHTAFVRDAAGKIDYPVRILSNEEYASIPYKSVSSSYPYNLYFRAEYPLAKIKVYPVPSVSGTTLHLECRAALSTYSAGTSTVDLPPGYAKYLTYQLAVDIGPEYEEASQTVHSEAMRAKALIKRTNLKDKPLMVNTARVATGKYRSNGSWLFG